MRISAQAMNAALADFKPLMYSKAKVSLYESYLVAKWMGAKARYPDPTISDADEAMTSMLELVPGHQLGRVYPFRYDWLTADGSGRKTVWNNTTRGTKLATSIFVDNDIRNGLIPNAERIVATALAGNPLPAKEALISLLLRDRSFTPTDDWATAEAQLLIQMGMSQAELDTVTDDRPLGVPLIGTLEWSPQTLDESLAPPSSVTVTAPVAATGGVAGGPTPPPVSIVVDARVERMLRRSVKYYPCVLLVGPPGTGKGTLVRWLVNAVELDPTSFGFDPSIVPNPMWRTPDESWSAFELVGGLAPDENAHLVWSHGLLINSLREQRWLVLDETNRADLDKIMGPLLTWLSDQEVEVGRTKPHGGDPIQLGWADGHASVSDKPDASGEPTRFLAGRDWRLVGTYNPQDAQRVFRMGQALSRRFVVVPVPALAPGQFENLLGDAQPNLTDDAKAAIAALYSAHYSSVETLLGPAVFLRLGKYLDAVPEADVPEYLAEAYVLNVGKFLSAFDDATFEALGTRIVEDELAMTMEQWEWTATQRLTVG